jgi:hypothetical protein
MKILNKKSQLKFISLKLRLELEVFCWHDLEKVEEVV